MMPSPNVKVARSVVSKITDDLYYAEASECRFPPGQWPRAIDVDSLGTFLLSEDVGDYTIYHLKGSNVKVKIFND